MIIESDHGTSILLDWPDYILPEVPLWCLRINGRKCVRPNRRQEGVSSDIVNRLQRYYLILLWGSCVTEFYGNT